MLGNKLHNEQEEIEVTVQTADELIQKGLAVDPELEKQNKALADAEKKAKAAAEKEAKKQAEFEAKKAAEEVQKQAEFEAKKAAEEVQKQAADDQQNTEDQSVDKKDQDAK